MTELDPNQIQWRVGQISKKDDHKGSLLGYIDARTCMEALDALDPNWSVVHGDPIIVGSEIIGVPCALTVNGITRSDVGAPSSAEPIKGAYSDALKRAAVHHGIGRELYELPRIYVKLDDYKKPVAIPTYRNGRWTLPPGAGSVFYDREPIEQPDRSGGPAKAAPSPRRSDPVQRTPEESTLLEMIQLAAVERGISKSALSLISDAVGVPKGQHANAVQLAAILERIETPSSGVPSAAGPGEGDGSDSLPTLDAAQPESPPSPAAPASRTVEEAIAAAEARAKDKTHEVAL
jgi:hypothetical protein